ncbi:two-component system response regulator BaeR [Limnohabitans sp. JirII-29]|uniref:response regulator n=1 Tax=Limnohabitans sp. JirII-29 TaxID=1835756 RepID=UPI000D39238D|nr:response regulator [Limnohabitans sp. JirII-29]PUE26228.1 two-component system response regulator BaeR [Limnohabitans sp. JirII-29]
MSQPRHILVVEDDARIAQLLLDYLAHEGWRASSESDGNQALHAVQRQMPDLVLLDVMLPGMDGVSLCRAIRQFSDVPIMMITARVDEVDRLLGLNTGADDYVCKPFSPREVMARVHALLRRSQSHGKAHIKPWEIQDEAMRIAWRGQSLNLTPLEYRLLRLFISQPGRVFSRAQLLEALHLELRDISDRAIDTHVKNLRRKIQAIEPDANCLTSVYGVGYRFEITEAV